MTQTIIRVVVQNGMLKPLDEVDLIEGKEYQASLWPQTVELTHEEITRRLLEAELLAEVDIPDDARVMTDEELDEIGRKLAVAGNSLDWVNEEREDRL